MYLNQAPHKRINAMSPFEISMIFEQLIPWN